MTQTLDPYVADWERRRQAGSSSERLDRTRRDALDRFLALGFPTTRDEEWRFTSVAPIAERTFTLAPRLAPVNGIIDRLRLDASTTELVFVNGHFTPTLSRLGALPQGSRVESLAGGAVDEAAAGHLARIAPFDQHAFVALNTAFLDDGAYLKLPAGVIVPQPIHVLFITTSASGRPVTHPRVLIVLEPNSQASVVETYAGDPEAAYFTNAVTEIVLGENAVLNHCKVQHESAAAYHIGSIQVRSGRSSTCASHSISLGGALVRNDIVAVLNGEGAECTLNGLYLADGQRLVDNHTTIDHAQPHCASREVYKGILADRARGVFNGKIVVRPDAQKTDAKQTNRALLLSEDALINTKPQLEIFANDVKCTHGAAVGQLDDEAVFYLRSRGLGEAAARQLLIHAFAADVLDRLSIEPIRARVEETLRRAVARALPAAA